MAQELIGVGSSANDGTGSKLREGGQKINSNFTELYQKDAQKASQISALQNTVGTHTTQIDALDGRIDVLEAEGGGGGDTIFGAQIAALQAADTVHSSQITALDGRLDILEAAGGSGGDTIVGAQILALQNADTLHSSQIAALQAADTVHGAQITSLQNADTLHGSQIAALEAAVGGGGITAAQAQAAAFMWGGTAGGTANALTLSLTPALSAYSTGLAIRFIVGASANTGAVTLAVNGLAAVAVNGGSGLAPLQAGALPPGALVTVLHDGTRFRLMTVGDGGRGVVCASDFGAVGNGLTDDTAAIQSALNSLGATGGTVQIPKGFKCLIDNNLTVPVNCHLVGPHSFVGTPGTNASAPYGNMGGALLVNSAKTITVSSGASLRGLLIYRKGMTFPAANSSAFSGTAITLAGDDTAIDSCMVMGFNKAVYSSGYQRQKIEYLLHDNINGIEITNCADIAYISNCHAWPFSNISIGGSYTNITRSGKAYYLHDLCDWAKITNCFSWGYGTGFQITSANSVTLTGCGADNATDGSPLNTGSIGFRIDFNSTDTTLVNCQAAANATAGIYISTAAGVQTKVLDATIWGGDTGTQGVYVNSGDAAIIGGNIRGQNNGVYVNNTSSRVFIDKVRFETILNKPALAPTPSRLVFLGDGNDYSNFTGSPAPSLLCQTVASAAAVNLPNSGDTFMITGETNFGSLGHGWAGRQVTLIFEDTLTVFNGWGAVANMRLQNGVNFNAQDGATLTLRHNGVQWFEIGRAT